MDAGSSSDIVTTAKLMTRPSLPISPPPPPWASKEVTRVTLGAVLCSVPGNASLPAQWRLYLEDPRTENTSFQVVLLPVVKASQDGNRIVCFRVGLMRDTRGPTIETIETITFGTMVENGQGFPTVERLADCLAAHGLQGMPTWPGQPDGLFPWCLRALDVWSRSGYLGEHAVALAKRKRSSLPVPFAPEAAVRR
ncbi:hypothetical protein CALVIDRAFT_68194 [Calocera viscosa TUFC12733]|uniref:Uncharacterized protein n=1 Tax=Calocera viscosa (strain TUFC12733) TaxID=1330018 RepID=A0A167N8V3_CALVF|nr:hypothetical protein CALVIDRAFT_68194 [Calocera viscosa TUFC12733]